MLPLRLRCVWVLCKILICFRMARHFYLFTFLFSLVTSLNNVHELKLTDDKAKLGKKITLHGRGRLTFEYNT